MLKLFFSFLSFAGKMLADERGELGEADASTGDQGGDSGADAGAGDTGALDEGSHDQADTNGDASGKPDWRVEKYGEGWENDVRYWRDNSQYAWSQYKTEKQRRQQSARGIEDSDPVDKPAQNGRQEASPKGGDDDLSGIENVKDLVEAIEKRQALKFEQSLAEKLTEREMRTNFRTSLAAARQAFNGEDGFPAFSDLEQEVLVPLVKNTPDVLKILRALPDPGAAAMTLALVLKAKTPVGLRKMFASEGYQELTDKINKTTQEAVRLKGGKGGKINAKLSPEDIKNMSTDEFEKLVARNTGRM